jgi:hypothetical protein
MHSTFSSRIVLICVLGCLVGAGFVRAIENEANSSKNEVQSPVLANSLQNQHYNEILRRISEAMRRHENQLEEQETEESSLEENNSYLPVGGADLDESSSEEELMKSAVKRAMLPFSKKSSADKKSSANSRRQQAARWDIGFVFLFIFFILN